MTNSQMLPPPITDPRELKEREPHPKDIDAQRIEIYNAMRSKTQRSHVEIRLRQKSVSMSALGSMPLGIRLLIFSVTLIILGLIIGISIANIYPVVSRYLY